MDVEALSAKPRLRLLLDHFARIKDTRQSWKVAYPLREVLFLVVCGTIASGDDYEDIVDWGKAHLSFLRGFAEFHFGIPCADWLRTVMNRIDPELFRDCFTSWVAECWPDKLGLVAIDGKTSRRSHNRRTGQKALHLVSAFATNSRLVLGQEAVVEKSNEITAIPALVDRLDLTGALVSIDAMGCNPTIAQSILDAGADYLLAVKDNQPTLHADIESYFETAPSNEVAKVETMDKEHGRFEVRNHTVSHKVDWYAAERSYPGAPRFPKLTTIAMVESRIANQEGAGDIIAIAWGSVACPVKAVRAWLEASNITTGPLLRPITKGGRIGSDRLADHTVVRVVKASARRVGLDPKLFAGHSLRSGFLTSAAGRGASIFKMMDVSRHKSMDTLRGYVRDAELFRDHAGAGLL